MSTTTSSAATATASSVIGNGNTTDGDSWLYTPNFDVALVATILFAIITLWLIVRIVRMKAWSMTALVIGGLMETLGFAARSHAAKNLNETTAYKTQLALTILAPILTQAAEYIILGRLMNYVGRRFSLLRPTLVSWIFICSDIVSFLIQLGGALIILQKSGNSSNSTPQEVQNDQNQLKTGDNVLIAGLSINLGSFIIFFAQITYFHLRTVKGNAPKGKWKTLLFVLYMSSTLVLIRQLYRIIQFSEGWFGYLNTHEVYFYVFDSLMIFLATGIYCWWFPHKFVPGDAQLRLRDDGGEWREMTKRERSPIV